MSGNLKQKAVKGIVWKFIGQGGAQLFQFISGVYIARILSPDDYGLVGMMAIFLGISQIFIDSGFRATLIQKGNSVTNVDYNVVFLFNLTVSGIFYVLIYVGAPYISEFYNEPRLILVARVLSLNLLITSLGIIHQTILEKKLNFKTLTKIRLVSIVISVLVGIAFAIKGFGVWALVFMTISESLIFTISIWIVNKWMPSFFFDKNAFKALFSKGIQIFFAGILQQINQNILALVIGRFFTTTDVGFYSQGRKLQKRIGDFVNSSIQGVMYPVQSLMKDDIQRLKNVVRKNIKFTTLVTFPAIVGLIAIAEPFIRLFLTDKWLQSVYYLQVLSVAGMIYILRSSGSTYLMALGKFNIVAGLGLFNNVILISLLIIGLVLGISLEYLVFSKVVQELIGLLAFMYYSKKILNYKIVEICNDIFPALIYSVCMGIIVFYVGESFGFSYWILVIQIVLGATLYVFLNYILNNKIYSEIRGSIKILIKQGIS